MTLRTLKEDSAAQLDLVIEAQLTDFIYDNNVLSRVALEKARRLFCHRLGL
jgi:hypothetical protein